MSIQYSKIAVIRIDKAGDLLLTTPALRVIKEQFPDSKTYLIASKQNSKVLINSELVDKIIVYDATTGKFSGYGTSEELGGE